VNLAIIGVRRERLIVDPAIVSVRSQVFIVNQPKVMRARRYSLMRFTTKLPTQLVGHPGPDPPKERVM
jgi:hypothetical protein